MVKHMDSPPKWVRWMWEADPAGSTSERSGLSVGKIVHAGIQLADAEGLEGVSVRKLAQQLGTSTMATYRHVDSREDIITAMVDVAFGPPPRAAILSGPWADGIRRWAHALHTRYDAHPWLLHAPMQGMPVGPNRLRWMEAILHVLARAGLDLQDQLDAALLIDGHVRSIATLNQSRQFTEQSAHTNAPTAWLLDYLEADGLNSMAQVFRAGALNDAQGPDINYGLDRIIAGIDISSSPSHDSAPAR